MPNVPAAVLVKCPFYLSHNAEKRQIRCEGVIDGTAATNTFARAARMDGHMDRCCNDVEAWKKCRHAQFCMAIYEKREQRRVSDASASSGCKSELNESTETEECEALRQLRGRRAWR